VLKNIPNGWEKDKLGNIVNLIIGKTPSRNISKYFLGDNLWTSIRDMNSMVITNTKEKITNEAVQISRIKQVKKGTLLLSYKLSIGKLSFAGKDLYTNEAIAGLEIINKSINNKFLYYLLKATDLERTTDRAVMGKTLNKAKLTLIPVAYPPLQQQEKIVKVLDISSSLIVKQKELLEKYDLFLKSKFIEMFGDPIKNQMGWEVIKMGTLMKIRRGSSPRPIDKFIGDDIPWIKIGDGSKGSDLYIEDTKVKIIEEGKNKSVYLKKGSLIFANCGVSLGFSRILKIDGCIHDGWLSFENLDKKINQLFILKLINHSTQRLRDSASGGTQPNLNIGIMKNFTIYLPPIDLQNKFARIVEKIETIKEKENKKLKYLEDLHNSLMQKAFKGEIK
jgi:restriction endonuclease S subunit